MDGVAHVMSEHAVATCASHLPSEVLRLLADPTFAVSSPIMFSAWGRRPTL
jgi:hypothetical protein